MSSLMQYFERTVRGMETYFAHDKMVVILIAGLLILWLGEKKAGNPESNRLLVYSATMSCLLLFPLTAVFAVIYQSAYYDYEWVWSMVPVAAVVAYSGVSLYEKKEKERHGKAFWWLAILLLVFFGGNQGRLQTATAEEKELGVSAEKILEVLESTFDTDRPVLWGPSGIMQEVRQKTGDIFLVYGKDMWDPKAGAYDYEAYSEELTQAYEWMDTLSMLETESSGAGAAELYDKYQIYDNLSHVFTAIWEAGGNVYVLPRTAADELEEVILQELAKYGNNIQKEYVEQYVIFLLKQ